MDAANANTGGRPMASPAQELMEALDALRRATNAQVAEREGRPLQLSLLDESAES